MQKNLYTYLMKNQSDNLPLIGSSADKILSKLQSDFNAKINRISELKLSIENVKQQSIEINQRVEAEIRPIERERKQAHKSLILAFVDASYTMKLSKPDKKRLDRYIVEELWELIHVAGQTDLIPIYDSFSKTDYKTEIQQIEKAQQRSMFTIFELMTGMDADDMDLGADADNLSTMERMQRMKAAYIEKMEKEEQEQQEKKDKKKKTAKQEIKAQKENEEAMMLTKTSRSIYLELAQELHPDRELDEKKRIWKTEIMQRITVAYNDNDLFELLSLRLEYIQNQKDSDEVPEKQLHLYIKILNDQISTLNQAYQELFDECNPNTNLSQLFGLGKAKNVVTRMINREKKSLLQDIEKINYAKSNAFQNPQTLKQFID